MKKKYTVTGMMCSACQASVETVVKGLEGINSVEVNLLSNSMKVDFDENVLDEKRIFDVVIEEGFGIENYVGFKEKNDQSVLQMKKRLFLSFIFFIPLFYITMGHMVGLPLPSFLTKLEYIYIYASIQLLLCIPIIVINFKYYKVGYSKLFKGNPNMDTLIAVGSSAAIIYGLFAI